MSANDSANDRRRYRFYERRKGRPENLLSRPKKGRVDRSIESGRGSREKEREKERDRPLSSLSDFNSLDAAAGKIPHRLEPIAFPQTNAAIPFLDLLVTRSIGNLEIVSKSGAQGGQDKTLLDRTVPDTRLVVL